LMLIFMLKLLLVYTFLLTLQQNKKERYPDLALIVFRLIV